MTITLLEVIVTIAGYVGGDSVGGLLFGRRLGPSRLVLGLVKRLLKKAKAKPEDISDEEMLALQVRSRQELLDDLS